MSALTPEQLKMLAEVRKEWEAVAKDTGPCDFKKAKDAVLRVLKECNEKPPALWTTARSPVDAAKLAVRYYQIQERLGSLNPSRAMGVVDQDDAVLVRLKGLLGPDPCLWLELVKAAGRVNGKGNAFTALKVAYQDFLAMDVTEYRSQLSKHIWSQGLGSFLAGRLVYYAAVGKLGQEQAVKPVKPLMDLARVCGWWSLYPDLCILQDRPKVLQVDERFRLHCSTGPAVRYRDGYKVYAVHGVLVPEWIVEEPEKITWKGILEEKNAEVRRVMTELFPGGVALLLQESGARKVATDDFGEVWVTGSTAQGNPGVDPIESVVCVRVICPSTLREYFLRVDPTAYRGAVLEHPRAAVASTWRKKDGTLFFQNWKDYNPKVQT